MEKDESRIPCIFRRISLQGRMKTAYGYILQGDSHTPIPEL